MRTRASDAAGRPEDETSRSTKRLDDIQPHSRVNDDRIRELISALGDPHHPQHAPAISELVAIGPDAVPALGSALSPDHPWLTAYRAAEALAQIGDGRASGSLINALRHPNSNVRWSAVRALAEVGDTRTLWALRRVAHEDRGKTSWGESVADTAQFALDRLQSRSALMRFSEPIKTALVFVAMFAAVLFATGRVQAVITELRKDVPAPTTLLAVDETTTPEPEEELVVEVSPTPEPTATPALTPTPTVIVTTVRGSTGNVRSTPDLGQNVIGLVNGGDEVIVIGRNGDWYLVRLGDKRAETSQIRGDEGWVSSIVINEPAGEVPSATPSSEQ